jgi:Spy/CpxP family protein refolding chaperone
MMVRQQIERLVRSEVRPTEAQMTQLRALDRRFERERGQLNQEEIAARRTLRDLMIDTVNVDQAKIEAAHNQLIKFPGRRAQLMEAEQKELATILTPLQRAKYWSIQEQVRRTIERGRGGRPPEGRGGPPPPPSTKRP